MSEATVPKPDPKVRRDGLCAVCRGERQPELSVRYAGPTAVFDPFCSSECCKRYHRPAECRG